ncbi:hypothetical protein J6590_009326 [Homalodisca vitripennis]|nr:hypothetical protein J6590_009326 [Homalodisca vitripennis]
MSVVVNSVTNIIDTMVEVIAEATSITRKTITSWPSSVNSHGDRSMIRFFYDRLWVLVGCSAEEIASQDPDETQTAVLIAFYLITTFSLTPLGQQTVLCGYLWLFTGLAAKSGLTNTSSNRSTKH